MPEENVTRRRHALLVDITQTAGEVSRLVHEARDLHLPVEPGVREGRDALVRWAVLLEEVLPWPGSLTSSSRMHQRPPQGSLRGPLACRQPRLVPTAGRPQATTSGEDRLPGRSARRG